MSDSDDLLFAAELVGLGVNLQNLTQTPIVDCTTVCPECGHGEALLGEPAEPSGFFETCLGCGHAYIDSTP